MATTRTTVYLTAADYRRLKALARATDRTTAALVREAVAEYARRHTPSARPKSLAAGRSRRGDADDRYHRPLRTHYERDPDAWVLPWAILPEVDYLLAEHVGSRAEDAFRADLAAGAYAVEWGNETGLIRAHALCSGRPRLLPRDL